MSVIETTQSTHRVLHSSGDYIESCICLETTHIVLYMSGDYTYILAFVWKVHIESCICLESTHRVLHLSGEYQCRLYLIALKVVFKMAAMKLRSQRPNIVP